jgi:hypothetical protein
MCEAEHGFPGEGLGTVVPRLAVACRTDDAPSTASGWGLSVIFGVWMLGSRQSVEQQWTGRNHITTSSLTA